MDSIIQNLINRMSLTPSLPLSPFQTRDPDRASPPLPHPDSDVTVPRLRNRHPDRDAERIRHGNVTPLPDQLRVQVLSQGPAHALRGLWLLGYLGYEARRWIRLRFCETRWAQRG